MTIAGGVHRYQGAGAERERGNEMATATVSTSMTRDVLFTIEVTIEPRTRTAVSPPHSMSSAFS
jgi:hypothetical protein